MKRLLLRIFKHASALLGTSSSRKADVTSGRALKNHELFAAGELIIWTGHI